MKTELNKEDSEMYMMLVKMGDMDKMFDFAYLLGKNDGLNIAIEPFKEFDKTVDN